MADELAQNLIRHMTVITLTTVGFREVHELSPAGQGFTILLALGCVFTLFYAATSIIGFIVGGQVEQLLESRRMERSLSELQSHLIVCGYGRMGRYVCQEFSQQGLPFVVIDRNADLLEGFAVRHGIALHGDAASDEILERVGVGRARALVSVVASDADNLYITLSARLLNDRLFIVARADDERSEQKLLRAGASRVISPYVIGGNRVAQAVLRPAVVDFLELATSTEHLELNIEEAKINDGSHLAGLSIDASPIEREHKVILGAIKKPTGKMVFNPAAETRMETGDTLIMLGGRRALDQIAAMAGGSRGLPFNSRFTAYSLAASGTGPNRCLPDEPSNLSMGRDMFSRLTQYWVYGGFLAGILILVLLPELSRHWSAAVLAVFLQLPIYMLHQYEEHDNDRFRIFFNRTIGTGQEVLSPAAVFVINVPGVWGVIAASFYLADYVAIGYGLIAAYLTLVNGVVHIVSAIASRRYNPGLATAVALFLPAGGLAIFQLQSTGEVGWHDHLLGLLTAIGIHAAIVGYVKTVKRAGVGHRATHFSPAA